MIKAIIFDNHGVLTTTNSETAYKMTADFFNVSVSKYKAVGIKMADGVDEGRVTTKDFLIKLLRAFKSKRSLEELKKVYLRSYQSKNEVKIFAKTLALKYELALLTDFGDTFDQHNKKWKLDKIFPKDKIFVSSKLKMCKPQKRIFLYVLRKLKREPAEVLFIDDDKKNIDAARNLKINSLYFTSLEKLKKDLKKYIKI